MSMRMGLDYMNGLYRVVDVAWLSEGRLPPFPNEHL